MGNRAELLGRPPETIQNNSELFFVLGHDCLSMGASRWVITGVYQTRASTGCSVSFETCGVKTV